MQEWRDYMDMECIMDCLLGYWDQVDMAQNKQDRQLGFVGSTDRVPDNLEN